VFSSWRVDVSSGLSSLFRGGFFLLETATIHLRSTGSIFETKHHDQSGEAFRCVLYLSR